MSDICKVKTKKHILVAPLNWGLGHATRCIPIIHALLSQSHKVTIASDGEALALLKKEFPALPSVSLPSYNIVYTKKGKDLKRKLLSQLPTIYKTIKAEHKELCRLLNELKIDGVISDNRLGLYSKKVPTVIISHQLQVLSGRTTWLSTSLQRRYLHKFTECWVPDLEGDINLSGILGHPPKKLKIPTRYIGPLSRMIAREEEITYTAVAILSGPEPQRTLLEETILKTFKKLDGEFLIVQGHITEEQEIKKIGRHITMINFLKSTELEKAINQSNYVLARSGYTTVMDLAVMKKKVFFIPTPGQTEQEYLADRLKDQKIAPFATQEKFRVKDLAKISVYPGFKKGIHVNDLTEFFGLFNRE